MSSLSSMCLFFFFYYTATTDIYTYGHTLSLHGALPICYQAGYGQCAGRRPGASRHQRLLQLADYSATVCSGRIRRRFRHHCRNVRKRRTDHCFERGWGACVTVKRRLVVGVTGATGAIYAVRMLQVLRAVPDVETHLVVSPPGVLNIKYELNQTRQDIPALADRVYSFRDVGANLSSGGLAKAGMVAIGRANV